jgi:ribosome maturation factor RimP
VGRAEGAAAGVIRIDAAAVSPLFLVSQLLVRVKNPVTLQGSVEKRWAVRPFFVCGTEKFALMAADLSQLLESTLSGMGYELVDFERSGKGKLLRVYIDKPEGINVDDCAAVSNHLGRLFAVENVEYDRLEISSPGLDRPLKKEQDFVRFAGHKARIKVRVPVEGQRNFVGVLRETRAGKVEIEVDGKVVLLDLANFDKARLVPAI